MEQPIFEAIDYVKNVSKKRLSLSLIFYQV